MIQLVRIKQVRNNPYKSIIHVNDLRALFPEEQIPFLEFFTYLQAVVFASNLCSFSIFLGFSNSVMYLAILWPGPFFYDFLMTFVNGLIVSFICSFCCSAALQCFHDAQIIMSANISLIINKKQSSTMTKVLSCSLEILSDLRWRFAAIVHRLKSLSIFAKASIY